MSEITIGSRWMTRAGRLAVVTHRQDHNAFPWRGYVSGNQVSWTEDGSFHRAGKDLLSSLDLVAPWVDAALAGAEQVDNVFRIEPDSMVVVEAATTVDAMDDAPAASGVTKQSLLEEAIAVVGGRGKSYGRPEDNFERIARRWNVHLLNRYGLAISLDAIDVALMMDDVKSARIENDPHHHDSWVDKAGYAACGGEIAGRARESAA